MHVGRRIFVSTRRWLQLYLVHHLGQLKSIGRRLPADRDGEVPQSLNLPEMASWQFFKSVSALRSFTCSPRKRAISRRKRRGSASGMRMRIRCLEPRREREEAEKEEGQVIAKRKARDVGTEVGWRQARRQADMRQGRQTGRQTRMRAHACTHAPRSCAKLRLQMARILLSRTWSIWFPRKSAAIRLYATRTAGRAGVCGRAGGRLWPGGRLGGRAMARAGTCVCLSE